MPFSSSCSDFDGVSFARLEKMQKSRERGVEVSVGSVDGCGGDLHMLDTSRVLGLVLGYILSNVSYKIRSNICMRTLFI